MHWVLILTMFNPLTGEFTTKQVGGPNATYPGFTGCNIARMHKTKSPGNHPNMKYTCFQRSMNHYNIEINL